MPRPRPPRAVTLLVRRVELGAGAATPTPGLGGETRPADGSPVTTTPRPGTLTTRQVPGTIGTVMVAETPDTRAGDIDTAVQEPGVVIIEQRRGYRRGATGVVQTERMTGGIQEAAGGRRRGDPAGDKERGITGVTMTGGGTRIGDGARRRRMTGDPIGAGTGVGGTSRGSPGTGRMTPWTDTGNAGL